VEHIHGNRSFEVSGSGLVAFDAAMNAVEMVDFILNQSDVNMRFSTDESGDTEWRGQVSISSASINAPQNSAAGYDFTMVGNGALTKFTVT
jgi:predicted secreted protein